MPISPETMRLLFAICLVGMALLAFLYLRRRLLSPAESLAWGLLVVFLPIFGPFLVILLHPGSSSSGTPRSDSQSETDPESRSIS